ncbi:MAG: DUF72 domain-containing protein [Candidatus Micrarchaeia archaeon]
MQYFVGTSGWLYSWNKEGTLDWYVEHSGLNAIELNASFYRFPFPNQIKSWSSKNGLTWVIKVNRLITHIHLLNEEAEKLFSKFLELFKPLEPHIALYLLQMPPKFTTNMKERLENFSKKFDERKLAYEFRHESWYNYNFSNLDFNGVVVSPDSPEINNTVLCVNGTVYLRFHGRESWYSYKYSKDELKEMAEKSFSLKPDKLFAFFNNDHDMLENARTFKELLASK